MSKLNFDTPIETPLKQVIDETIVTPLTLLGGRAESDELLDSLIASNAEKGSAGTGFSGLRDKLHGDMRAEEPKPEEPPAPPAPKQDEGKEEKDAADDDDYTRQFLALNEQQQETRSRQESLERYLAEQTRILQQQMQPPGQQHQDEPEWDFTDPGHVKAFRQSVIEQARKEATASQMPILQQVALSQFNAAVSEAKTSHEHFDKYFPASTLQQFIGGLMQRMHPQQLAQTNWKAELERAYKAVDYDRLMKQLAKQEEQRETARKDKQDAKASLALVPKANAQGASGRPGLEERLNQLNPRTSIRNFKNVLKRELLGS